MIEGILAGIIANLIFIGGGAVLAGVVTLLIIVRARSRRLRFLGLRRPYDVSTLPIYIAHLVVVRGGTLLADGTPSKYFEGSAVPIREVEAAERIRHMLRPIGILEYLPDAFRARLNRMSVGFLDLNTPIIPAPLQIDQIAHLPRAIVIGGPEFNMAAGHFLDKAGLFRILDPAECVVPTVVLNREGGVEELIAPDSDDYNLGIVERASFDQGNQIVLLLSGIGTNGTLAAVDWFVKNWDQLGDRLGASDFGVCLQCRKRSSDPKGWAHWAVRRLYPDGILTGWKT